MELCRVNFPDSDATDDEPEDKTWTTIPQCAKMPSEQGNWNLSITILVDGLQAHLSDINKPDENVPALLQNGIENLAS